MSARITPPLGTHNDAQCLCTLAVQPHAHARASVPCIPTPAGCVSVFPSMTLMHGPCNALPPQAPSARSPSARSPQGSATYAGTGRAGGADGWGGPSRSTPDSSSKVDSGGGLSRRPSAVFMRPLEEGAATQPWADHDRDRDRDRASEAANPLTHLGLAPSSGPSAARRYSGAGTGGPGGLLLGTPHGPSGPASGSGFYSHTGAALAASMTPVRESGGPHGADKWTTVSGSGLFPRTYDGPGIMMEGGPTPSGSRWTGPGPLTNRGPGWAPGSHMAHAPSRQLLAPASASASGPALLPYMGGSGGGGTPGGVPWGPRAAPATRGGADMFSVIGGGAGVSGAPSGGGRPSASASVTALPRDQYSAIGGAGTGVGRRW
jgi:hypothetical protein